MDKARYAVVFFLGLLGLSPIIHSIAVSGIGAPVWKVAVHIVLLLLTAASPVVTNRMSVTLLFPVLLPAIVVLSPPAAGLIGAVGSFQLIQLHARKNILVVNRMLIGLPAFTASLIYHWLAADAALWSSQSVIAMIVASYAYEILNHILTIVIIRIDRPEQRLNMFALTYNNLRAFSFSLVLGLILTLIFSTSETLFVLLVMLFFFNRDAFRSMLINQNLYSQIINAMVKVIENTDPYTKGHSERVAAYSTAIARKMGFKLMDLNSLHLMATLHDLGKHSIPPEILRKPSALTPEEYRIVQGHCRKGEEVLRGISLFKPVQLRTIGEHHEHWDGTGYPKGLTGEHICKWARIIAVADAFDAMTSDRPYRPAMSPQAAVEELKRNAGKQFDPEIVGIFVSIVDSPQIQEVLNSRERIARKPEDNVEATAPIRNSIRYRGRTDPATLARSSETAHHAPTLTGTSKTSP